MDFGREDYNQYFNSVKSQNIHFDIDEPVFLLRASDPLAPRILLDYSTAIRLSTGNAEVADSAVKHAQKMLDWQSMHPTKYADFMQNHPEQLKKDDRIQQLISNLEVDEKLTEDQLMELDDLVTDRYGTGSFMTLFSSDISIRCINGIADYTAKDDSMMTDAKLVVGVLNRSKMIIIKNTL